MKILIIEDDAAVRQELKQLLENALYQTAVLAAFENITQDILEMQPDLVLLDVNLPGQSGFDVCQSVRGKSDVPIIFVTGRTDSMDELNGMLKGIAAVLKRTQRADPGVKREIHRGVELDTARACVMYQGKCAELSKNELKILHCLFQHKDEIVPRIDLVEYLWDQQAFIDDNALSVNVARLRAKLEQIGIHHFIQTKRGMGYRI